VPDVLVELVQLVLAACTLKKDAETIAYFHEVWIIVRNALAHVGKNLFARINGFVNMSEPGQYS
jgi:hypothetical protein